MKTALAVVVAALLAVFATASDVASRVTPVEKVLELLKGMLAKSEEGKHAEATQWAAYKQFCSNTEAGKQDRVKATNVKIESLEADMLFFDAEVDRLSGEIKGHEADLVDYKKSSTSATDVRGDERKSYMALHQDYSESVTAIAKAIEVMKKQDYDRPQAAALLQRVAAAAPAKARHAIEVFLEADGDDLSLVGEPGEANAYEFQSGGIVEMLKELSDKFVSKRTELEKEEMEKAHKYNMLALDLQNSMAAAKHEIAKKSETMSNNKQGIADAKSQHKQLSATRDDDVAFLEELHTTCNQKAADFSSREELRAAEITALGKAIDILAGSAVKGAAETHLPSLLGKGGSVAKTAAKALVQTRSLRKASASAQEQAALFLQGASERLGSSILFAVSIKVKDDVFDKVKKMIQDLIVRLEAEAAEEADHKKWCDEELGSNEKTRTEKSSQIEALTSTIDELGTRVAQLKRTIAEHSKAISELTASMAAALDLREKEKAENEDTIAEAVGAQEAVSNAIQVLQDFYQEASKATSLVQSRASAKAPPIFDKPFTGQQSESGNVIAFLQVIQSDFARLESQTQGSEEAAQSEYDTFMSNAGTDKSQKETDVGEAKDELDQKQIDLETAKNDIELAHTELDTALEYYDKLKPSCISANTEASSEERIKRREQELGTLREALSILEGESLGPGQGGPQSLYSSTQGGNVGMDIGVTAN